MAVCYPTIYGQSITYDAIGNPTNYMGATMTWFGRQMQSYSKGNTSITYKYDSDGLRTQKVVNGVQYDYYYVDGQLRYEKKGDEYEIIYRYNNDGTLASVTRNRFSDGKTDILYAVTNTRGDVIELRSGSGAVNTVYTYDSWGKLISVTNASGTELASTNLGVQNSIRYRGYVYDTETGLYYLQSRYYDPEIGRFLNADDVDFIGASETVLSFNAFAFCENNSVNDSDTTGYAKGSLTAVGLQIEISASAVSLSGVVGVEFIYVWKTNKLYTYFYRGGGGAFGYSREAGRYLKASFKDIVMSPKVSLKNIKNLFDFSISYSVGFFFVRTWGSFSWTNDSYSGYSTGSSVSVKSVKGYKAIGNECAVYDICYTRPCFFSMSETTAYYTKVTFSISGVKSYLSKMREKIIKAVNK